MSRSSPQIGGEFWLIHRQIVHEGSSPVNAYIGIMREVHLLSAFFRQPGPLINSTMLRFYLCLLTFLWTCPKSLVAQSQKPILIVTTDIGQDPDDQQSMVRLLHYANDFQIAGLIANADGNYDHEPPEIRTDILFTLVEAYEKIYPNLKKVDPAYPIPAELRKVIKSGTSGNGRKVPVETYVGEGKNTEGSDWIIQQVDAATRTVNIAVWGGACDLAQALFDVSASRSPEEVEKFISKIRVYFIGKQDSSNQWIIDNYPDLWLVLGLSYDGNSWNSSYRGIFLGGDMQSTSPEWLHQNVIGQQVLSDLYPPKAYTQGGSKNPHGAMKEGDTPSFLFFLENGLNQPSRPNFGGWGGRFQQVERNFYRDAEDTVYDLSTRETVTQAKATVFRWRPDIQADLAARVQWGLDLPATINHYPAIQVNQSSGKAPLQIHARPGEELILNASLSSDPDGDRLSFEWMLYPEAGSFQDLENVKVSKLNEAQLTLNIPNQETGEIHLILRVKDDAQYPLVSYKRVIITVEETEELPLIIFDTDMGSDCDDVGALAILHTYQNQGKTKLLGCIYSSGKVPFGAGIIDAINTYYGRGNIPIGAEYDTSFGDPVDKMLAGKLARDTAAFGHDVIFNRDVPEHVPVNRRLLAAQGDQSVTYLTVGHTKALHDLLKSEPDNISELSGMELVRKKVKRWVALGGLKANLSTDYGSKDWNFFRNGTQAYTDYLLENFPGPVYLINAGSDVLTGQSLVHAKSGTIVRTAYRDWLWEVEEKTLLDGRPSWDLAAACFAVEMGSPYFEVPEKGILQFDVENGSIWQKDPNGTHFYVNQKEGVAEAFAAYLNSLMK